MFMSTVIATTASNVGASQPTDDSIFLRKHLGVMDTLRTMSVRRDQDMPVFNTDKHAPRLSSLNLTQQYETGSGAYNIIPRTQDELKHVSRLVIYTPHCSVPAQQGAYSGRIPRTPSPSSSPYKPQGKLPSPASIPNMQGRSKSLHMPRIRTQRIRQRFETAGTLLKRRHMETIVDDEPQPRVVKSQSPSIGSGCSAVRSTEQKKLLPVPANAPQDIERKGKYTFVKGVRIKDYRLPLARPLPAHPKTCQYQCRDGFLSDGEPVGSLRIEQSRTIDAERQPHQNYWPSKESPLTPRSISPKRSPADEYIHRAPEALPIETRVKDEAAEPMEDIVNSPGACHKVERSRQSTGDFTL